MAKAVALKYVRFVDISEYCLLLKVEFHNCAINCCFESVHIKVRPRAKLVIRVIFNVWKRECDQCKEAILRLVAKVIFHANPLTRYEKLF